MIVAISLPSSSIVKWAHYPADHRMSEEYETKGISNQKTTGKKDVYLMSYTSGKSWSIGRKESAL